MNTFGLHKALKDGNLNDVIKDLSENDKRQLIDSLKWEIVNYNRACLNYSEDKRRRHSTPYLERREILKKKLEDSMGA